MPDAVTQTEGCIPLHRTVDPEVASSSLVGVPLCRSPAERFFSYITDCFIWKVDACV